MLQDKALAILKSGQNVFLTGSAGTGKTYVLNQYIKWLKDHKVAVAVTASTGIAATHMNGSTIHSWSGIGIKNSLSNSDLRNLKTKKYLTKHVENTHVLIIDEISMLHKKQLDMINQVLKYIRNSIAPFGGMQVVLAGDFFQLPPVSKELESSRNKMAFMSQAWLDIAPKVCYLTEQYRQEKDELTDILNGIRARNVSFEHIDQLNSTIKNEHSITPTKLYTHNADVDLINNQELAKLDGKMMSYSGQKKGNQKMMEFFLNSLLVGEVFQCKLGAKVMFLKNNHDLGVMNGTLGEIVDFVEDEESAEKLPLVLLANKRKVLARPEKWSINNEKGNALVSMEQIPLRLAWAITVHKSQGMTLEAAEVDLSKTFEPGQGYVALSRLKSLDGLKLLGLNDKALEVDQLAFRADKRFQELSEEADLVSSEVYEVDWKDHILASGGTTDPKEIKKAKLKNTAKAKKISTFEITVLMIKDKKSLLQISNERGLNVSTIQGHIKRISVDYPDVDISMYKPDDSIFRKIADAYANALIKAKPEDFSSDGHLKSSIIFNALGRSVDYGTIKLAYAYIPAK